MAWLVRERWRAAESDTRLLSLYTEWSTDCRVEVLRMRDSGYLDTDSRYASYLRFLLVQPLSIPDLDEWILAGYLYQKPRLSPQEYVHPPSFTEAEGHLLHRSIFFRLQVQYGIASVELSFSCESSPCMYDLGVYYVCTPRSKILVLY